MHPVRSLDRSWLDAWCRDLTRRTAVLMEGFEATYGYPPGENAVVRANQETRTKVETLAVHPSVATELVSLYAVLDSVSLPDIDNGYFIHGPDMVAEQLTEYGPVELGEFGGTGVVFGSDGGGILFAIDAGGRIHRSVTPSWFDAFVVLAPDLYDFLDQLRDSAARC